MNFKNRKVKLKSVKVVHKDGGDRLILEIALRMDAPDARDDGYRDALREWFAERVLTRPQLFMPVDFEGLDNLKREDMTPDQLDRLETLQRRSAEPIKLEQGSPREWRERVHLKVWSVALQDRVEEADASEASPETLPVIRFSSAKCDPKMKIEAWGGRAEVVIKFSALTSLVNDDLNVARLGELLSLPLYMDLTADPSQQAFDFDDDALEAARAFRDSIPAGTTVTMESGGKSVTLRGGGPGSKGGGLPN